MRKSLFMPEKVFIKHFGILSPFFDSLPLWSPTSLSSIQISLASMLYQHIIKLNINFLLLLCLSAVNALHLCFWRALKLSGRVAEHSANTRLLDERDLIDNLIHQRRRNRRRLQSLVSLVERRSLQPEKSFKWAFRVCTTLEAEFPLSISRQKP